MTQAQISCGIDFGTSNSTCAVFNGAEVISVSLEGDNTVIPSAIFFSSEDRSTYFGKAAIQRYVEGEEGRLLRGLKSILGTSLMDERTVVGNKSRSFVDILSIFIGNIKSKADEFAGKSIENVVMGRPVHFHDNNPSADDKSEAVLRGIAEKIGFKNIHFQYEPIAAAYSHEQALDEEKIALVVDLGGGTSDFTVIRLSPERKTRADRKDDILATSGVRIGGTNFDKSLSMGSFMPYLGLGSVYHSEFDKGKILEVSSKVYDDLSDWPFIHQAQGVKAIAQTNELLRTAAEPEKLSRLLAVQEKHQGHAFLQAVEQAKIKLTDVENYKADLSALGLNFGVETSQEDFVAFIQAMVERIEQSMDGCIAKAGCTNDDIGLVILTGGSSEIPVINEMVGLKFPNAKLSKDDKFGSVGRGLAYNAAQLF